ncbi:thioredoxin domain-containing protein 11 [Eucyclogobius newberryi]|uniref:thioredoxin domain-containing protein 11 n=1 Tax=Eucyclogobius newberryi TaxID=166745 RepID=UPI003B5CF156
MLLLLRRLRQSLRRQVLFLMARRPELMCGAIVLGVLLLLAVKFTCGRAKNVVAPARPPGRFFSSEAPVVDLYLGQIDQVERLRSVAEVSLIFLYAPWCAHSMAARQEVQLVAQKLAKQVQFVAVNCWWSHGRCRKQKRLYQYPSIQIFYRRFGPIEYKGPFVAPYVESFILKVLTPLTYLSSEAVLQDFLSYHEPRVVGFFQFSSSPQSPEYVTFMLSALQALRRDFRGAVRFGVVTSRRVAQTIPVPEEGSIYLHRRFNSSLIFPRAELNFTSEAICNWVFRHYETVLQWLQPPGTKSRLLEEELLKGPALLLFLPHDPLGPQPSALLQQVEDLAVQYHSCPSEGAPCCHSVPVPLSSAVCELCLERQGSGGSSGCPVPSVGPSGLPHCCLHDSCPVCCSCLLSHYSALSHYRACCQCRGPRDLATVAPPAPLAAGPGSVQFTGLRCLTNKTLGFYLLDAELNWPLAVRLGATHNSSSMPQEPGAPKRSFAAIVDLKDEVHYVLQPSQTAMLTQDLEGFIVNFSAPYSPLHRHLVGQEEALSSPPLLITEVTSSSFSHTVLDVQQDVLLLCYTQWCGFCSVLHHLLIQLARLLQGNSALTVARVNVALNDLPWEFMVDRVPTVLLFPRYRKHQSVKFPEEQPITLPNLLRFVLQHCDSVRPPDRGGGEGSPGLLRAQVQALQAEVGQLHKACERLSQQLAWLWRDHRRLSMDARALETHNQELQQERRSLEEQHRQKSRQLGQAVRRLQELAHTSESLLHENTLLQVLLRALRDRTEEEEEDSGEEEMDPTEEEMDPTEEEMDPTENSEQERVVSS